MAEVLVVDTPADAGALVGDYIARRVADEPTLCLGVATGSTPIPVYRALADQSDDGIDFSQSSAFALDEYVGLSPDHPESYRAVVDREVTKPLGLDPSRVNVPDGSRATIETAGERYEQLLIASGGVDVQLLGVGTDGHIAFNEPGSSFASLTRVKTLTEQTRRDNARFFDSPEDVPLHSVTQGLGTILRARHLVMLAFGAVKADAVAAALEGPLSASMPASAIQLHPHVTVVVDEPASAALVHLDYYRMAQANKPDWQGL